MSQNLTQRIGDTKTHSVKLSWGSRPFVPGNGWTLTFNLKSDPNTQEDAACAFQKAFPGGNITVTGHMAHVGVLPQDTKGDSLADPPVLPLVPGTYYWDIQAAQVSDPSNVHTVADGEMELKRDVGREIGPTLDVHTVAPPLLFFSYQSYLDTDPDPVLTEAQWVSRLGTSNPDIVATYPPLPSSDNMELGRTFAEPYEGLQWFDPSDGSTSVWMWFDPTAANDDESYGVFVSQFPTPVSGEIPDGAMQDENGAYYVDENGAYYTLT